MASLTYQVISRNGCSRNNDLTVAHCESLESWFLHLLFALLLLAQVLAASYWLLLDVYSKAILQVWTSFFFSLFPVIRVVFLQHQVYHNSFHGKLILNESLSFLSCWGHCGTTHEWETNNYLLMSIFQIWRVVHSTRGLNSATAFVLPLSNSLAGQKQKIMRSMS